MSETQYPLGRLYSPDERDKKFPMRSRLPMQAVNQVKYWNDDYWWGDQGQTPQCVAYAWTHWLEDGPILKDRTLYPLPCVNPPDLYHQAQLNDEWDGEDYSGTSVRAGAKVLRNIGFITEYTWAWDANEVAIAVLDVGPVVVGTRWYNGMFTPDGNGRVHLTGSIVGGHAYVLNGYDSTTKMFRIKNSWGKNWGKGGHAFIHFDDLNKLLNDGGEACLAQEIGPKEPTVVDPENPDPIDPGPVDPGKPPNDDDDGDFILVRLVRAIINFIRGLFR